MIPPEPCESSSGKPPNVVSPMTRPTSFALPITLNVARASGITPRKTASSQSHTSRVAFGGLFRVAG
jgi:hypothetical protein